MHTAITHCQQNESRRVIHGSSGPNLEYIVHASYRNADSAALVPMAETATLGAQPLNGRTQEIGSTVRMPSFKTPSIICDSLSLATSLNSDLAGVGAEWPFKFPMQPSRNWYSRRTARTTM